MAGESDVAVAGGGGNVLTGYHAKYFAYELQPSYANDHIGKFGGPIDERPFEAHLVQRRGEFEREVQTRKARHYAQQEEILYRSQPDRKAGHEGQIRDCRAKEKEARRLARAADDPMEQLRQKREARRWEHKAEDADEAFRAARRQLRDEADDFLDLIEQSLSGTQTTEHLFTIRWRIDA